MPGAKSPIYVMHMGDRNSVLGPLLPSKMHISGKLQLGAEPELELGTLMSDVGFPNTHYLSGNILNNGNAFYFLLFVRKY